MLASLPIHRLHYLSKSRLELGCVSAVDCEGRTIWIANAHRSQFCT
jgi:hypothetical protein